MARSRSSDTTRVLPQDPHGAYTFTNLGRNAYVINNSYRKQFAVIILPQNKNHPEATNKRKGESRVTIYSENQGLPIERRGKVRALWLFETSKEAGATVFIEIGSALLRLIQRESNRKKRGVSQVFSDIDFY